MDYLPDELFLRSIKEMARLCRVSERTVRRWRDRTRRPSEQELMILRGDLGVFDPKWSGWTARDGFLISPEGWRINLNDILASKLKDGQVRAYQSEVRKLRYELEQALKAGYEDQPEPADWDVQILTG